MADVLDAILYMYENLKYLILFDSLINNIENNVLPNSRIYI